MTLKLIRASRKQNAAMYARRNSNSNRATYALMLLSPSTINKLDNPSGLRLAGGQPQERMWRFALAHANFAYVLGVGSVRKPTIAQCMAQFGRRGETYKPVADAA